MLIRRNIKNIIPLQRSGARRAGWLNIALRCVSTTPSGFACHPSSGGELSIVETLKNFSVLLLSLLLCACASNDSLPSNYKNYDVSHIPNAVPKVEPLSRYGNPPSYKVLGVQYHVLKSAECFHEKGIASWYGTKFHGKLTSNRESYNMFAMTAANKVLPLPTYVKVTNLENGKVIIVRVNDRGPFHQNRIIDLSFVAAKKIDMLGKGVALVEIETIDPRHPNSKCGDNKIAHAPILYLQIGVFSTEDKAIALQQRIETVTTEPVRIIAITQNQTRLYKVRLGPLKNVNELDTLTTILESKGFGRAFAVIN